MGCGRHRCGSCIKPVSLLWFLPVEVYCEETYRKQRDDWYNNPRLEPVFLQDNCQINERSFFIFIVDSYLDPRQDDSGLVTQVQGLKLFGDSSVIF